MEIASLSALALGFIGVGSCNYEVTSTILQTLMEREDSHLNEKWARFMALGLALLFLGKTFHGWAYAGLLLIRPSSCRPTRRLRRHYRDSEGDPSSAIETSSDISRRLLIRRDQQRPQSAESSSLLQRSRGQGEGGRHFPSVCRHWHCSRRYG
jgi:hypothetical protein